MDVRLDGGTTAYPCFDVVLTDGRVGLWSPTGFDGREPSAVSAGEVRGPATLVRSGRFLDEVRGRVRAEHGLRARLALWRHDGEAVLVATQE